VELVFGHILNPIFNTFANHFAKLVLGVSTESPKHQHGPSIGGSMPDWGLT